MPQAAMIRRLPRIRPVLLGPKLLVPRVQLLLDKQAVHVGVPAPLREDIRGPGGVLLHHRLMLGLELLISLLVLLEPYYGGAESASEGRDESGILGGAV